LVELSLEREEYPRQIATAELAFSLTPQDREDIRWYLEDYLEHANDPAPQIAARIEARMSEIGHELFAEIFQADEDARGLWSTLRPEISDARIEILTDVQGANAIPWELLCDPKSDVPLALRSRAFVRGAHQSTHRARLSQSPSWPIRVLLVICRPGGRDDVPFRSVASRLIKGLGRHANEACQLDVLRPPTFEQLGVVLWKAKSTGQSYHVVHFDGHGVYLDASIASFSDNLPGSQMLSGLREGSRGYLVFENPALKHNTLFVDGQALGKLLVETGVPVLLLNACRSAHAEAPPKPISVDPSANPGLELHAKARAFGSLAQEVVDAGVFGVVAMRYNVYVVTAVQFVTDLYDSLVTGQSLGEAVTLGRKKLDAQPFRDIAYAPRKLQDWVVPIVYETAPIAFFPSSNSKLQIEFDGETHGRQSGEIGNSSDLGFFGRDETLLALDRAFDSQTIVLLHAYAGSGKTATASEFANWYQMTGGINGPVIFTSFEHKKTLSQVLNETIGRTFGKSLEQSGIQWLALNEEKQREVALQVMKRIPLLWIWDNVEPIAGFPTGSPSAWTPEQQLALADFLCAARETKVKFLLTSRRDECLWLGNLAARIKMPPMPMQERVQLARALAAKHGRSFTEAQHWLPLLRFTNGNPLSIIVLVSQALREGLCRKEQIEALVTRLCAGEQAFADEESEGRSKSLGASLRYGFEQAFDDIERRQLALLYLFQGFVQAQVLHVMGRSDVGWCLDELRGTTVESCIILLDRGAEIGLLSPRGRGRYTIHPAVPWFLSSLFQRYYSDSPDSEGSPKMRAVRAFVEAISALGEQCHLVYNAGNRNAILPLIAEEANLLQARRWSIEQGWWARGIAAMQGLQTLYERTGATQAEWVSLVKETVPDFVNPRTDGPLPGREDQWGIITHYRVMLLEDAREWTEAERLQKLKLRWQRGHTASALTALPSEWNDKQRTAIFNLAVSLGALGGILLHQGKPDCIEQFEEAVHLYDKIGNRASQSIDALRLGHAYKDISAIRDLTRAEYWYRRSLDLHELGDTLGRGQCLNQLGAVAHERFAKPRKHKAQKDFWNRLGFSI
jgi:CHAT domain